MLRLSGHADRIGNWSLHRLFSIDRRFAVGGIGLALLLVLGLGAYLTLTGPGSRLSTAMHSIVAGSAPEDVHDSAGLARVLGLASVPPDVDLTIKDWTVSQPDGNTWQASWTVVASGNGTQTAAPFTAQFWEMDEQFGWSAATGYFDLAPFIPQMETVQAAQAFVQAFNDANSILGSTAVLSSETILDTTAAVPDPIEVTDPELLQGVVEPIPGESGTPPKVEQHFVVIDGQQYPVLASPLAAVPAKVAVGSLDPADLISGAGEALDGFAAAHAALDVEAAKGYLLNGEALTESGLAASTISELSADDLEVSGTRGNYYVVAAGIEIHQDDGQWRIDYSGQPTAVLSFIGELSYNGECMPSYGGCPWRGGTPSPLSASLQPVTVLAGQSTLDLVLRVTRGDGDRRYADDFVMSDLRINGREVPEVAGVVCSLRASTSDRSKICPIEGVSVPSGPLESISMHMAFGSPIGGKYAEADFASN